MFHTVVRLSQDGLNVPPEAEEVLRVGGLSGQTSGARVLDLFTNDGTWVQEMAEVYPTASFVSVDVKPFSPHQPRSNITFEVYDFYAGIAEPDSSFDVINAMQCIVETKDFNLLLREMHRVLKPHGVLVITDIPFWSYGVENPSLAQGPESRHAVGLDWLRRAFQAQGVDITAWGDVCARLSRRHPLWAERSIDPEAGVFEPQNTANSVRGFQSINMRTRLIPAGPWPEDEAQRMIGSATYLLITHCWKLCGPFLRMIGMEGEEIQSMADAIATELAEGRIKGYLKCHRWTARKL
ncbi:hypothetical protein FRC10_001710 [Ceratobasidium sp. 414]|nr:hypothetical protein FRC10_001710 [Ceratobasidium sp. 414]